MRTRTRKNWWEPGIRFICGYEYCECFVPGEYEEGLFAVLLLHCSKRLGDVKEEAIEN